MSPSPPLPSSSPLSETGLDLLRQAPELAILYTLLTALECSHSALQVAQSELGEEDFAVAPHSPSAQACLAEALLQQMQALRRTLHRYCSLIAMQALWDRVRPPPSPPDSEPF